MNILHYKNLKTNKLILISKPYVEMLIQTVGDKIHLLPCWPKDKDVCFKLHAPKKKHYGKIGVYQWENHEAECESPKEREKKMW